MPFEGESGPQIPIDDLDNPLSMFNMIFDEEIIETIFSQSQIYKRQVNIGSNYQFDSYKIRSLLGISILMGVNRRQALYDHWSSRDLLSSVVSDNISREEYKFLWSNLHLEDNEEINSNVVKVSIFLAKM